MTRLDSWLLAEGPEWLYCGVVAVAVTVAVAVAVSESTHTHTRTHTDGKSHTQPHVALYLVLSFCLIHYTLRICRVSRFPSRSSFEIPLPFGLCVFEPSCLLHTHTHTHTQATVLGPPHPRTVQQQDRSHWSCFYSGRAER